MSLARAPALPRSPRVELVSQSRPTLGRNPAQLHLNTHISIHDSSSRSSLQAPPLCCRRSRRCRCVAAAASPPPPQHHNPAGSPPISRDEMLLRARRVRSLLATLCCHRAVPCLRSHRHLSRRQQTTAHTLSVLPPPPKPQTPTPTPPNPNSSTKRPGPKARSASSIRS